MDKKIVFSIIIPTFNRADIIMDSIKSVLDQSYKNFELLVVDDGSTDNTSDVLRSLASDKIQYFKIPNSERAVARNYGIAHAKGDYITFLDSDDIYYTDYLANAFESITKYSNPPFFHLAYEFISAYTNKSIWKPVVANNDIRSLVKGNHLSCIGIFVRKDVAVNFRFNEDRNLSGSEDWELWLRLAANFGLKTDGRISGALMVHDSRSVFNYPEEKLLMRKNLALKYAFEDPAVREKFGIYKNAMEAYCDTYISLHLALSRQNRKAISYLFRAFLIYPLTIFTIRTIVIIKFLLLNLLRLRN